MFSFRSAKSPVKCKGTNKQSRENPRSIDGENKKCKVSIFEVCMLNFRMYNNPKIVSEK
jgi:hypothetical protein